MRSNLCIPLFQCKDTAAHARQYFIGVHNETLSVAAMRVNRFGSFVFKLRKMLCLTDHRSLITYHLP
jgi:hypothetical protein